MNPRKSTTVADAASTAAAEAETGKPLYVASLGVRWRDLDAFNHVNNSNYLTYLEEARLQWLSHVPGPWFDDHAMPVMAASQVNYRRPIAWPAQLQVQLFCERMGNSSMTITHRVLDAEHPDQLYCDGHVVMVWMDPASGKPVPLPEAIRGAVA
ncbi:MULTISPECIES: acyl-CoA thioesterase [Rhodanobacter]|uniref:acyl-CoA thioesterase n=1 Tax=Rhodanobacter TaxID=75309 RepID=UPI0002610305|nr:MULTISPECIES: thioesterase family protein [Rhodanobacter]EIM01446.1 thioesterase superfamily protein [Rhodanobacter denitrificans]KZC19204.1 thioesterase [Rhodanobacter denitrificans]UJJ49861.1 acyl-CoA thioesterase [Rhodanobacter denitrificans]UJM91820.1 acyl-CoA thioesterase [Rhodanobacter denitrificans]UJM92574.1 acyl-CoA thioesterase [Rhodanobacter denitrificans]